MLSLGLNSSLGRGSSPSLTSLTLTSTTTAGITFTDAASIQRILWGSGAYLTYDLAGSFHAFSGDLAVGTNLYCTVLRGNSGTANTVNLHPSAGLNIQAGSSGSVKMYGSSTALTLLRQVGANSEIAEIGGVLNVNTTAVGNVGASGPDDLQTYQLPANSLTTTGRGIRIRAWGTTANTANAKTVRLTIGPTPTALITKILNVSVAGTWELEACIIRTGASTQDYYAKAINHQGTALIGVGADAAAAFSNSAVGTLTQTETNALDIKTQSTVSTANNDIVSEGLIVEYF